MEKPSLDQVIKKLEELDIREWGREDNYYGKMFIARIGPLRVYTFKWEKYHQISISNINQDLWVKYYNEKNDSDEEKKIFGFYTKICKEYEEYKKKEFDEAIKQIFSD